MSLEEYEKQYDPIEYKARRLAEVRSKLCYDEWAIQTLIFEDLEVLLEDDGQI